MAVARVVTFDGVSRDRLEQMKREMEQGERPQELPATEVLVLHDAEAEKSLVVVFFENEADGPSASLYRVPAGAVQRCSPPGARALLPACQRTVTGQSTLGKPIVNEVSASCNA